MNIHVGPTGIFTRHEIAANVARATFSAYGWVDFSAVDRELKTHDFYFDRNTVKRGIKTVVHEFQLRKRTKVYAL